jgi:hypothetical protein
MVCLVGRRKNVGDVTGDLERANGERRQKLVSGKAKTDDIVSRARTRR